MPAATMELRKHIKAPKRYSRELEEDSPPVSPTDVRQQSKPSRIKAKIVKYNPDLPPVAFPTLDPRTTLACDNSRSGKHGVPVRLASARKHIKDRGSLSVSSTEREVTASALKHLQHPREMSASQAKQYSNDNGPGNPIWEKNMKLMDEWDARNEEDWFVKGCETSDEEGIPGLSVSSEALWDAIPLALQIEMVYAATGSDNQAERAMIRLKMNQMQREVMVEELRLHQAREEAEDDYIAFHQARMNDIPLNGRESRLNQNLFEDFYQRISNIERNDIVASKAQVMDAMAYMKSCGLDPSELDSFLPKEITDSNEELERRYPHAPKISEVIAAIEVKAVEAAAEEALRDESMMSEHEALCERVSSPLPAGNEDEGEVSDNEVQREEPAFKKRKTTGETIEVDVRDRPLVGKGSDQGMNGTRPSPSNHINGDVNSNKDQPVSKKRKITGETIEMDVGGQRFQGNNPVQVMKDSIPSQANGSSSFGYVFEDCPRTPEQTTRQASVLDQTLTGALAITSVGWPATPPTPSQGVVPILDSSKSEYNPKSKQQHPKVPSNSKAASTPGFSQASGASGTPMARTTSGRLVMLSPKVTKRRETNESCEDQARQSLPVKQIGGHILEGGSIVDATSSSATTEQDSTIVVDISGQKTRGAQKAGTDGDAAMGGGEVAETKPKPKKRGRPRKPKGD